MIIRSDTSSPINSGMAAAATVLSFLLLLMISPLPLAVSDAPSSDAESLLLLKHSFDNADSTPLKSWSSSSASPPCEWPGVVCFRGIVTGLRLASMNLTGTVDVDALSHLNSLRSISLNNNRLSGPIPPLGRLDGLKSVYLSNNGFSGAVPDDFFAQMDHLKKIWLDGNGLSGAIPSSLSKAVSLMELHLDRNNFSSAIPDFDIPSLKSFNMSDNVGLAGPIPAPLAKFGPGSFQGIPGLCGAPLSTPCGAPDTDGEVHAEENRGNGGVVTVMVVLLLTLIVFLMAKRKRQEVARFEVMEEETAEAMEAAAAAEAVVDPGQKRAEGSAARAGAAELVMVNEEKGVFGLGDLMKASAEVLGNGGMGSAYKAVMGNGAAVVVKRMRELNRVGKDAFDAEMRRFGRLKHRNVLTPLAYHYRKEEKLVVSEFVSRGSLLYLLHGDHGAEHAALDWPTRLKIIRGVVRGTTYLHGELTTTDVPHANLKSGNVLLNHEFEPLVVDYGLFALVNPSAAPSVLFAYKSPEAVQHRHVCPKSDVYCLGILILEILTGKFPSQYLNNTTGGTDVVQCSVSAVSEGREAELLDTDISGPSRNSVEDMVRLLRLGVACTESDLERRPSMKEVAASVEEIATTAREPETKGGNTESFKKAYEGSSSRSDSG